MLTIVELGPVAPTRIEGLRALLDDLDADSAVELGLEGGLKWVLIQPGKSQWSEAHGYDLIVEHVEAPRWALHTPALALPHPRRLLDLVHLYRPAALVCRSPLLAPLAASLAGLRLNPRPARLCTWVEGRSEGAGPKLLERGLGGLAARLGPRLEGALEFGLERWGELGLSSFDALLVADEAGAVRLRGAGIRSLYLTPRGVDRSCFHALRAERDATHAAAPRVFVELGQGVPLASLRRLDAALCRGLPRDPRLCVHAPGRARDPAFVRFVEGRAHVELCPPGDASVRAQRLRDSEIALLLPGIDDGSCVELEARACGCPVLAARGPSSQATSEAMLARVLPLLRAAGSRAASKLGSPHSAVPVPDRLASLHVELRSILAAVAAVHGRGRTPAGLHRLRGAQRGALEAGAERDTTSS